MAYKIKERKSFMMILKFFILILFFETTEKRGCFSKLKYL